MLALTAAFSVSEQIKNVGAYAGLASILGLAVLSLLYFGQARELKRLRDWAGRAPERTAELQEQADAATAAAAQRRPDAAAAPGTPAPAVARTTAPATAAGAAARPLAAGPVVATAGAATAAGAAGAATAGTSSAAPGGPSAPASPLLARHPGRAARPRNRAESSRQRAGVPAGRGGAPRSPGPRAPRSRPTVAGQETQSMPPVAPPPPAVPSVAAAAPIGPPGPPTDDSPVPLRQVAALPGSGLPRRRPDPVPQPAAPERAAGSRGRRLGIIGGGLAVLVLAVVLATQLLGGGDTAKTPGSVSTGNTLVEPTASDTSAAAPTVTPGDYQVYVLNGTQQNGLAAEVSKTLEMAGFRSAGAGTAAVQTAPTTEVFYSSGKKKGATAVAGKLKVAAANVKQADQAVSVQAQGADVIVVIGADKATP